MAEVTPSGGNNTQTLGRGLQGAENPAGNNKQTSPDTTSTKDLRDASPVYSESLAATREVPAVRPGRGLHDGSKLGG